MIQRAYFITAKVEHIILGYALKARMTYGESCDVC